MYRRRRRRSYRPRRYSRRRRYYPSLLRTQMNDSETRTMSFTQNMDLPFTFAQGVQGVCSSLSFGNILSGSTASEHVALSSGRVYYAGMMYDRFRVKSCSVQVRPKVMPAATGVSNYIFYFAWDRYYNDYDLTGEESANPRVVTDDPSAKMIIWSPGGNASTLSHYVYSLPKDRYQYVAIDHKSNSSAWSTSVPNRSAFLPVLRYVIDLGNEQTTSLSIRLIFMFRFTLEFMGAASIGTGTDYSPIPFKFQSTADPSASGQPRLVPPN